ncbi:hypothetical protein PY365_25710 [Roseiarcaceae bacterium H3SJ34-1]|uniref:DUF883 family protein n=1 Tax=Terripilifer ovatus TaxID=3032367 RepID=UPI003AB99A2F|nr:hypothetical protein [Roseiarcaceae bacterium H3SJ34-1]
MAEMKDIENVGRKAAEDYNSLREDIAKLSDTVSKLVAKQAEEASAKVKDAMGSAKTVMSDTASKAQDRALSAGAEIEASIERNPYSAVLIALGVGVALGLLNRSRS